MEELNGQLPVQQQIPPESDAALAGPDGTLDSLSIVTLLANVEQKLGDEFHLHVSLIDDVVGSDLEETNWTVERLHLHIMNRAK